MAERAAVEGDRIRRTRNGYFVLDAIADQYKPGLTEAGLLERHVQERRVLEQQH